MIRQFVAWGPEGEEKETPILHLIVDDIDDHEQHRGARRDLAAVAEQCGGTLVYDEMDGVTIHLHIVGAPYETIERLEDDGWTW